MVFKRKVYQKLLEWKKKCGTSYAVLLEGARRVGKSTIVDEFAKNEFKTYISVDFSNITNAMSDVFNDIANLEMFFNRLQLITGVTLYRGESAIIFDEIQLAPKVRQAIKHLVADGRYYYIETGSLISIKKNIKDIVIPSEELRIQMYPMDYEEFMCAIGNNTYDVLRDLYRTNNGVGNDINRKLMRDFRTYMAIGGMPQSVKAYVDGENFEKIDNVKKEIIAIYKDDFRRIDNSGRISNLFEAIPSALSLNKKRFILSSALAKRKTRKDEDLFYELLDSKTVLPSYNVTDPSLSLNLTKDIDSYKLYLADTGLFTTLLFNGGGNANIYNQLLSDKLDINLGYLYENAVAQVIASSDRELFYHIWSKADKTRKYEVDFLLTDNKKIVPIEVKSSSTRYHSSITEFSKKYSSKVGKAYLLSQNDVSSKENLLLKPIYLLPFILEELV